MSAQEYPDQLIDQHIYGGKQLSPSDETIAPMLAATKMLGQLQEIALPPEFARHLAVSLRARIHTRSRQ
jgi:hypothetical protein